MNPAIISAGIGLLGGMLGGRPQIPGYVKRQHELQNSLLQRGMDLYDNTDLEALDSQAVGRYSDATMQRAMTLLGNYDARAAGAGSPMWKGDTAKGRARSQIAGDASSRVADFEAGLLTSRPQRKAALLPGASQAAAGFNSAAYLDQSALANQQAQMTGIMDLAQIAAAALGGNRGGGAGRNDRFLLGAAKPVDWTAALRGVR